MQLLRSTIVFSLFISLLLVACSGNEAQSSEAASNATSPVIEVTVANAPAGNVLVVATVGDQQFIQDTTQVEAGGTAVFSRSEPYPYGLYMAYYADKTAVQFLLDGDQEFSLTTKKGDVNNSMAVKGSKTNELFYDTRRFEAGLQPRLQSVNQRLQAETKGTPAYDAIKKEQDLLVEERKKYLEDLFKNNPGNLYASFKQAGQNPEIRKELVNPDGSPDNAAQVEAYKKDFWSNVDFNDTTLLRTPVIYNKLKRYMEELTPRNANAIIESADYLMEQVLDKPQYLRYFANWITLKYEPGNTPLMDGEAVYVNMIQKYFTPELAFWTDSMTVYGLQQRAGEMAQSLVGNPGPNITVPDINGTPRTLYDQKEPYVIVFMYNPTCEHCIEQTPKVLQAIRQQPAGELGLYAVAIDTEAGPWKKFVQQYNMQAFTNVYDPTNRSIYKTYYVDHTPELYLLNPDRIIIGKNLKASQIAEVIARDKAK